MQNDKGMTIGRLAEAACVSVETVRFYQQRGLLPIPARQGTYRHYPQSAIARLRFIKRAKELGFTLTEIAELLRLNDGMNRRAIRGVATRRLEEINSRLDDLRRMQRVLKRLVIACERSDEALPCPIIDAIARPERP